MSNLRDPFNPKTGEFAKNVRSITGLDDSELRESLKRFGWLSDLPALVDENEVVLVGHRRIRLAKQLGIEPVIKTIHIGEGDEADAKRLALAIASNLGHAAMSKEDRKRIAEYLYGKREWTMQRIAEALNVAQSTITEDLRNLSTTDKSKPARTDANPKGAGRPKGSKARRKNESISAETAATQILNGSKTYPEAERETGFSNTVLRSAVAREEGRREAEQQIERGTLAMSAQQRLDAAIRQYKRKLDTEFEMRVLDECKRRLNDISLPHYAKELSELERSISSRKGVMDRVTYRKILACLHPDRVQEPVLKKRYEEAFRLFTELEKRVLDEKQSPTEFRKMPRTYEELMAMKRKVQEGRRAKRAGGVAQR